MNTLDPRFAYRVLKMSNLRKRLNAEVLVQAIREVYPPDHPSVASLLSLLDNVRSNCVFSDSRNHPWKLMHPLGKQKKYAK